MEQASSRIRSVGLLLGPLLFGLMFLLPLPSLALGEGTVVPDMALRSALGLMLWMAAWWMSEALPLAATSLLPLAVLPLCGVMPAKLIAGTYFDEFIVLFLGGFCLALALEESGLHRRIAWHVIRISGTRPRPLVFGFLAAASILSMWVSNTATAMMLLPVALTVADAVGHGAKPQAREKLVVACVLAVAFGASIGGIGTLVGTPPNALLAGMYNERFKSAIEAGNMPHLGFGLWMAIGVPVVVILVPICWWILVRVAPGVPGKLQEEQGNAAADSTGILEQLKPQARMNFAEATVMGIFIMTALAWITHAPIRIGDVQVPLTGWDQVFRFGSKSSYLNDGAIAIIAAIALFAIPSRKPEGGALLTWEFARTRLPFGALLLLGGGLALAAGMKAGGINDYFQAAFGGLEGAPLAVILGCTILGITVMSELSSNTATAAMMLPLLATLAGALKLEPLVLMAAGTLAASCGYALPVATPPNTIAYGSGRVSVGTMVRSGLWLDLCAMGVMFFVALWLIPALLA